MTPEEERTVAAVTAKLAGKVYPGVRFNLAGHVYTVESQEHDAYGNWWVARAIGTQYGPGVFREEEILARLIP